MKKQIKKFVVLALAVGMLATSILGASAAFDPVYYAAQNPDVVKALGNSPAMLKLHYDMFGRKEARMSNKNDVEAQLRRLFDEKEYAKLYPDVKKAFGDDKEMMFKHYIAFGLLEGRRPSEKVSQAAAVSMKKTVEKAMKDAGLAATPGAAEVVAVITGETSNVVSTGGAAVQQALTQVAAVVAKEVTAAVKEVQNPASVKSDGGGAPAPSSQPPKRQPKEHRLDVSGSNPGNYLQTYIDSPQVGSDDMIKLIGDTNTIDIGTTVLTINKNITLDLNGKTITYSGTGNTFGVIVKGKVTIKNTSDTIAKITGTAGGGINVATGGDLTVGDGEKEIEVSGAGKEGIKVGDGAKLTVEKKVTVKSTSYYAVAIKDIEDTKITAKSVVTIRGTLNAAYGFLVNGNRKDETIKDEVTIEEAIITSTAGDGAAMYLAGNAKTTVTSSTLSGTKEGIEIRAGELIITGTADKKTTITSTETTLKSYFKSSGSTAEGVTLAVSQHTTKLPIKVTVGANVELNSGSDAVVYVTDRWNNETTSVNKNNIMVDLESMTVPSDKKIYQGGNINLSDSKHKLPSGVSAVTTGFASDTPTQTADLGE